MSLKGLTVPMLQGRMGQQQPSRNRWSTFHISRYFLGPKLQTNHKSEKISIGKRKRKKAKELKKSLQHRQERRILSNGKCGNQQTILLETKIKREGSYYIPWSKSSPRGLDELVRLACLPSTASKV
jgi:hypothetical protein